MLDENNSLTAPQDSTVTLYSKDIGNNETVNTFDLAEVILPSAQDLEYGQQIKDSVLTGGSVEIQGITGTWKWAAGRVTPKPGITLQTVRFIPDDTSALRSFDAEISVTAKLPDILETEYPSYHNITYGQTLLEAELQQTGSVSGIEGAWEWEQPELLLNAGTHIVTANFIPLSPGEPSRTVELTVTVLKATPDVQIPMDLWIVYGDSGSAHCQRRRYFTSL